MAKRSKPKMPKHRNEHARALRARAGNDGCAIAVDTRPKVIGDKKKFSKTRDRKHANVNVRDYE